MFISLIGGRYPIIAICLYITYLILLRWLKILKYFVEWKKISTFVHRNAINKSFLTFFYESKSLFCSLYK